jgi:outer membrane protein insertion porin family/translocation and assembly module TamA
MDAISRVLRALVLVAVGFGPVAAQAADEPKIEVRSLEFVGVKGVDPGELKDALATRVSSRLPFFGREHLFDRARFQADLERIRAYYLDHGFPDARVTSFDVQLDEEQTRVDITIHVSEGEPLRVAALEFRGFEAVPLGRMNAVRRRSEVRPGEPVDRAAVLATHEQAINALRDHGHPFARVAVDQVKGADPRQLTIVFRAEPGVRAYFGDSEVTGNKRVDDWVVQRELLFKPGDLYRRRDVLDSQRKLYSLELFEFVNVQALRPPDADAAVARKDNGGGEASDGQAQPEADSVRVPMRVTIAEAKHHRVRFAVGYGTEEQARGEVHYQHLNFLGGARTAGVRAKWSSLDRGVRFEFRQPYLYHPRLSLDLVGQHWYESEPGYESTASGGYATLRYRVAADTGLAFTFTDEYDSSRVAESALIDPEFQKQLIALGLDPITGRQSGTLVAFALDFQRTTAMPNLLNATRGYVIALHVERAVRILGGSFAYTGASLDGRYYRRLNDRIVVANRVELGSLKPVDGQVGSVPYSKRYYLGGATTIRGWGRYEVGPTTSGTPIGGFSMVHATAELRVSVRGQLGVVAFLDIGNVWSDPWSFHFDDLRYAIGPGLRYNTPVGPLRLDVGYQLNPIPGLLVDGKPESRQWRVHFSIGQAF